jgi:hypothetical protein
MILAEKRGGACALCAKKKRIKNVIMKKLEADIKQEVFRWCERRGVLHAKLDRPGYPDDIFFVPGGVPLLLELKRPGEKPAPLQEHTMRQLMARGYNVGWTDSSQVAIAMIEGLLVNNAETV